MADLTPGNGGGTPRWVKVSGVIAIVVVLLFAIHLFFGGMPGTHGLRAGGQTLP